MEVCYMMKNTISLTSNGCTCGCGWMDGCGCDWACGSGCGCGNSCGNGCGCSGGCANGCTNGCGCLNGCSGGCANGCTGSCTGSCGCHGGCGCTWDSGSSCGCGGCGCYWPDVPALASGGMLMSRIVATGRACVRANDVTLCVQDIPECAQPPYALVGLTASGPTDWEFLNIERWRAVLRVTIPLTVQIKDCAGCIYSGHSSVTVDVPVNITIPQRHPGRMHVQVMPSIRLLCVDGCSEDGCFTVSVAVLVDVYVVRWEPSSDGITVPCRPDLPLTLPPSFHRCCR